MGYSQSELVSRFVNGKHPNVQAGSLHTWGDMLVSYGSHFPLLREVKPGVFVLNADKRSISTSGHQRVAQSGVREAGKKLVAVARTAFLQAGLDPFGTSYRAASPELLDFWEDGFESWHLSRVEPAATPWVEPPKGPGWDVSINRDKDFNPIWWQAHRPGCSLWRANARYYLCGMDEGSYFLCLLSHEVRTVHQAFKSLMPKAVSEAGTFQRQGEWYFVPTDRRTADLPRPTHRMYLLDSSPLQPVGLQTSSGHTVTEARVNGQRVWCRGFVRHQGRQHARLTLGQTWHEVFRNTSLGGWNAEGRVD